MVCLVYIRKEIMKKEIGESLRREKYVRNIVDFKGCLV